MQDPHLAWIAECREELDTYDDEDIESCRAEAEAALERVVGAGDPRGVGDSYRDLLRELSTRRLTLELDELLADLDLPGLARLLDATDREIRLRAIQRAGQVGLAGAFKAVVEHLAREDDAHVVATTLRSLGSLGGEAAVPIYEGFRDHPDGRVRANAVEGLCDAGVDVAQLLTWRGDPDHRVRANVAFGLMERAPREAREIFRGLVSEASTAGTKAVVDVLCQIEVTRFLELYLDALDHLPASQVAGVLAAMTRRPEPRITRLLLELMDDPARSFGFRSQVMQAARDLAARCGEEDETSKELLDEAVARFFAEVTASERSVPSPDPPPAATPAEPPAGDPGAPAAPPRLSGAQKMQANARRWVRLNGRVIDSSNRKPVAQATIRLASSGRQEVTDRRGRFSLDRLLRGDTYVLVVERQGYPTRSVRYRCSGQSDQSLQIVLIGSRTR